MLPVTNCGKFGLLKDSGLHCLEVGYLLGLDYDLRSSPAYLISGSYSLWDEVTPVLTSVNATNGPSTCFQGSEL